jgi:hypothetical protein
MTPVATASTATSETMAPMAYHQGSVGSCARTADGQASAGFPSVNGSRARIVATAPGDISSQRPPWTKATISPVNQITNPAAVASASPARRTTS